MISKLLKRIFYWGIFLPIALMISILFIIYLKQDAIVQSQLTSINEHHQGEISVEDVHLAPFENFPDISLKIDNVVIREKKEENAPIILQVADIYVGFNIWDFIKGNYDVISLKVENGFIDLVLHPDGKTNLENALAAPSEVDDEDEIDFHLQNITLNNIDFHQIEEATNLDIETYIFWANGAINTANKLVDAHIDSQFELNVIDNRDTTYFKHKHFEFHTDLSFDETNGMLTFRPSGIIIEHGNFQLEGSIDTQNEMTVDISIQGTKPSFDMFIAFAPQELIPVLERYENAGKIYFNASLKGPTTDGQQPLIDAKFGASEAYLENSSEKKRIDEMGFKGHFTNGKDRNFQTMEFSLTDMNANLDKGKFVGNILVKNFEEPEIDMQLDADFDIAFLIGFLNLSEIKETEGSVKLHMKFHDIIDLDHPENALSELNQAYYAELKIDGLKFNSESLPSNLKRLDAHLEMNGKAAELDKFDLLFGNSDLSITGELSNLPAIVHHSETPVIANLKVKSQLLDLAQLTQYTEKDSTGVNERIENLSLSFSFNALANAFTESEYLPVGEFFIDDLFANLNHYPHTLHDFHADVLIDDEDLRIEDFTGQIDASDFHFNGLIHDYKFWLQDDLNGDVDLDVTLRSDLLKLHDLLSYQGVNYVPEEYRHEQIDGLMMHAQSSLHYKSNALHSIDLQLDQLSGKMHIHPLRIEDFNGKFHYEDEHLQVQGFEGKMGRTDFEIDMDYYLGKDPLIMKRDNAFNLKSRFVDFDALSNFNDHGASNGVLSVSDTVASAHEKAFNIYEIPFSEMQLNVDIGHFIYHRLDLQSIKGQLHTTRDHHIHLDTLSLNAAGGTFALSGLLNGSNPKDIHMRPKLKMNSIDLDQLLFKFENFGQDAIVSENLHGKLTASIDGDVRLYPDFVADLSRSEVHIDAQVLSGQLKNYPPMMMLSEYFGNKNLTCVKFDTLQNHIDITYGTITIPNMTIESTLGHMDIAGTHDMDHNIDYYVRIPWSLVKNTAKNKIFGSKKSNEENDIIELDPEKKIKYLNININGTLDDYKIKVGKSKSALQSTSSE